MIVEDVPRRGRVVLTGAAFAVSFFYAVYVGAFGSVLPAIGQTLGLGASVQGRLFPATFGGAVVGVLFCGYLSDRFGRKPVILACLAGVAAGMLLFGQATLFPAALLASALVGAGCQSAQTVATALLSDLHPERRAHYMNAMQVAFGGGAVLAAPAMQGLIALGGTWRTLYLALGSASALLLLVLVFVPVPPTTAAGAALNLTLLRSLVRRPIVALLCVSAGIYAGAEVGFFSWMPSLFQDEMPSGAAYAGYVASLFWAAMWVGRTVTAGFVTRLPLRRMRLTLSLGAALCGTLTLLLSHPIPALVGIALTGLCFSGIFGLILAEASERFPETAGTVIGAIAATSGVGAALVPYAISLVAEAGFSWRIALGIVPLASLAVAALAGLTLRGARRSLPDTALTAPRVG